MDQGSLQLLGAAVAGAAVYKLVEFLLAAAKGDQTEAFGPNPSEAACADIMEGRYFASPSAGLWLHRRCWSDVAGAPRGIVVMVHGYGEHIGRYSHVARRFNELGLIAHGMDHQGHGGSEGVRGYVPRYTHLVDDVVAFAHLVEKEEEEAAQAEGRDALPLFLYAHSMGGLLSFHAALQTQDMWRGVVLSAPLMKPDPKTATPLLITLANLLSTILPQLPVEQLNSAFVSRDPHVVRNYNRDPGNYSGELKPRMGSEMLKGMAAAHERASEATFPLLVYHGTNDGLANVDGSRQLAEEVGMDDFTFKLYDDGFHELHNDTIRDKVLGDLMEWVEARL